MGYALLLEGSFDNRENLDSKQIQQKHLWLHLTLSRKEAPFLENILTWGMKNMDGWQLQFALVDHVIPPNRYVFLNLTVESLAAKHLC